MPPSPSLMTAEMSLARNGGDYSALFLGKTLQFKTKEMVLESIDDNVDIAGDERFRQNNKTDSQREMGPLVMELSKQLGDPAAKLKVAFLGLLDKFSHLREAMELAFKPIIQGTGMVLSAAIDLIASMIPDVFERFVSGVIKAILPFIGQIDAVIEMVKSVGKFAKSAVERRAIGRAVVNLDPKSKFTQQARKVCMKLIDDELKELGMDAAMSTGNCVVSFTGMAFTGNLVSTIGGIATSLGKLIVQVVNFFRICRERKRGNEALDVFKSNPTLLNPSRLFQANADPGSLLPRLCDAKQYHFVYRSRCRATRIDELAASLRVGRSRALAAADQSPSACQRFVSAACLKLDPTHGSVFE